MVTGLSVATVLFFFLDYGGKYGLPLLISPLMFCLGTYIFILILPRLKKADFLEKGTTLHSFVGKSFNSSKLRYSSAFVSIIGYLGIFVIEVYVGVKIFELFGLTPQGKVLVAMFIMSLIFVYIYLGGYKAVIDTDRLQFWLISIGTLVTIGSLVSFQFTLPKTRPIELFPYPGWLPIPLLIVLIVGNVPFQILRMSHWQRAAAVQNIKVIKSGLKKGIIISFIIWIVFCTMGLLLYRIADFQKHGALVFLDMVRNSAPLNLVVFPIVFTAMIAAIISTADTVFVAIINSYIYDIRFHKKLHDENGNALFQLDKEVQKKGLRSARRAILLFLSVGILLYYLLTRVFHFEFYDLLFVFFLQQLALFPAVVLALRAPNGAARPARRGALYGMWAGWLAAWGISIYARQVDNCDLILCTAAIAWAVSIIVTIAISPRAVFGIVRRGA